MELHRRSLAFALLIIFASQPTQTAAAKLKIGKEKVSRLHFYFHERVSGKNVTAVQVASAPSTNTSRTYFGSVVVIDDHLTEGPDPTSKSLGRAQGVYALSSQEDLQLLMVVTYVFQSGEFKGSTLAVVGHSAVFDEVREMPIVGGSGRFRLARGYVIARTLSFDPHTGNALAHYNVTVLHH